MSLKEKLEQLAEASAKKMPDDVIAVVKRTGQALADTMATRNIPKVGDRLPEFEMSDSTGTIVRSENLVENGPFVLSFFRGKW